MRLWILVGALSLSGLALADVVHLKDGTKVEGAIKRDQGGWNVTTSAGKTVFISDELIDVIEKISKLTPEEVADSRLSSLRRSMETLADPQQAVERLAKFIEQNTNTRAAADATKDLAIWHDRIERKLVKVGSSWVSAEELVAMIQKTVALVDVAREQLKQGRQRDADGTVTQILTVDPNSVAGIYLRALISYKQGELGVAKKNWEHLKDLLPDHAPTMNNLGVVLWQQKQYAGALVALEGAMGAQARSRQILDNVAEALNSLPENQRDTTLSKRVAKKFIDQDTELQRDMEARGLYRWGATFITAEQQAEIKKAQYALQQKRDALKADYDKIQDRIRQIERRIDQNDRSMRDIQNDRVVMDRTTGQLVRLPLPGIYYDLQHESNRLRDDRVDLIRKLDEFPGKLRQLEQELPIPPFTGQLRLFETEGTPLPMPPKLPAPRVPATQPK